MPQHQNIKTSIDFVDINGIGKVRTGRGFRDAYIYGYFKKWHWTFIVHQSLEDPRYVTVSEASTGCILQDECYYSVEDALYYALPFIEQKHYYFATAVGDKLVRWQVNLLGINSTGLQTPAIYLMLWS